MPVSVLAIGNAANGPVVEGDAPAQFPFGQFVQWLLSRGSEPAVEVVVLNGYSPNQRFSMQLANSTHLKLLYGSGLNEKLITAAINKVGGWGDKF